MSEKCFKELKQNMHKITDWLCGDENVLDANAGSDSLSFCCR